MAVTDCARFLAEDPAPLVEASFACPWCLTSAQSTVVALGSHDSVARCVCPQCAEDWELSLHAGQVLRLTLAPPPMLAVRFAREGSGWPAGAA
ncbi:MAG: hypothetical protein JWM31_3264 [Solirubrobacterales bacterium]|nr:hypothetical protein [Solirubrobacterales bacterium]